jgi:16S rRNA (guanine527-N7)-methyltransferase
VKQTPQSPHGSTPAQPADLLRSELAELGLHLPDQVLADCLAHWDLLLTGGPNLVSPGDLERGPVRHTGDALACLVRWPLEGALHLLDIGTGGGFPGIPLAIARPGLRVTLLESRERKTDWLVRAAHELGLKDRLSVVTGRLEEQPVDWLERFEVITARAVAPPDELIRLVLPGLRVGGRLLLWHSDRQRHTIQAMLYKSHLPHVYELIDTLSHRFMSIDFLTNISCIQRVR